MSIWLAMYAISERLRKVFGFHERSEGCAGGDAVNSNRGDLHADQTEAASYR